MRASQLLKTSGKDVLLTSESDIQIYKQICGQKELSDAEKLELIIDGKGSDDLIYALILQRVVSERLMFALVDSGYINFHHLIEFVPVTKLPKGVIDGFIRAGYITLDHAWELYLDNVIDIRQMPHQTLPLAISLKKSLCELEDFKYLASYILTLDDLYLTILEDLRMVLETRIEREQDKTVDELIAQHNASAAAAMCHPVEECFESTMWVQHQAGEFVEELITLSGLLKKIAQAADPRATDNIDDYAEAARKLTLQEKRYVEEYVAFARLYGEFFQSIKTCLKNLKSDVSKFVDGGSETSETFSVRGAVSIGGLRQSTHLQFSVFDASVMHHSFQAVTKFMSRQKALAAAPELIRNLCELVNNVENLTGIEEIFEMLGNVIDTLAVPSDDHKAEAFRTAYLKRIGELRFPSGEKSVHAHVLDHLAVPGVHGGHQPSPRIGRKAVGSRLASPAVSPATTPAATRKY